MDSRHNLPLPPDGGSPEQGTTLLAVYALGLGLPFLLFGLAVTRALSLMRRLRRHWRYVSVASGASLVLFGVFLATGQLSAITARLSRLSGAEIAEPSPAAPRRRGGQTPHASPAPARGDLLPRAATLATWKELATLEGALPLEATKTAVCDGFSVGAARFGLGTSGPPDQRANQAAARPATLRKGSERVRGAPNVGYAAPPRVVFPHT